MIVIIVANKSNKKYFLWNQLDAIIFSFFLHLYNIKQKQNNQMASSRAKTR